MPNECMITTMDNPYDYFTQFTLWDLFDKEKGYNTCSYLARLVYLTDDMTEEEEAAEIERAIDSILELNPLGIYKKIFKKEKK